MRTVESTPAADGFRMPAEWEPHDGCWMAWPHNGYVWREGARPAQRALAALANAVADTGEAVTVTVTGDQYAHARSRLDSRVRVVETTSWLGWARDIAPTFVVDGTGRRRGVDFAFNGYGNRYPYWATDDQYAQRVLDLTATDRYRAPLVLEGGSFHVDGQGTALVTAETLLDPARNDSPSRAAMHHLMAAYLGVTRTVWIEWGLACDGTRGHVDNMTCFAAPGVVCLTWTDDTSDPQYERSARALEDLRNVQDARGRTLRVEKLPLPGPLYATEAELRGTDRHGVPTTGTAPRPRLAASYANFYATQDHLFVPLLDPEHDDEALARLARIHPHHTVVGLPTRELLLGGGNIHCATQQIPSSSAVATGPVSGAGRRLRSNHSYARNPAGHPAR
ncbi:agmatine deiminase [Streptomyces sp. DR7-3]|uniref:agmatine deiminase n=1 Tax=Streptomyces malaysiensis TaxID=92644 RepID=UPI002042D8F9|nr:agmatine deiminase [Streptomyces sp. DR7-3]MCM3810884.1 agmatine deiminase [Streptomyces sp. DR7-3]